MEATQTTITVKRNGIHILLVLITLMCLVSFRDYHSFGSQIMYP